jgi:deoxyribonuclease-4
LCLDTAHAYGAGYDLSRPPGIDRLLEDLARGPGLDAVKIVHLNDSRVIRNSRRDRHWHLGQGAIGLAGLRHLLSHPWFKPEAAIMETPKPHQAYEWYNLLVARSLVPGTLLLPAGEICSGRPGRVGPAL